MSSINIHADDNEDVRVRINTLSGKDSYTLHIVADNIDTAFFVNRAQIDAIFGQLNNWLDKQHAEKLERYAELRSEIEHDQLLSGERA